jgi:hypothetical protein
MVLKKFSFNARRKRISLLVKGVSVLSPGLLFRKKSPILLWDLKKEKNFSIFSLFCRPFIAIWISDDKMVTKAEKIDRWRWKINGQGRYLIEVPETDENYLKMTKRLDFPDG